MKIGKKGNWDHWTLGKMIFGKTRNWEIANLEKCKSGRIEIW